MPAYRAQVILKTLDAIPANFITNSWCFSAPTPEEVTDAPAGLLKDFYDDISTYISPLIVQNGHLIKWSALPGTPPNYPFYETTWNFTSAPAGGILPEELAICMSFQGDRSAGLAQDRRRGRVFLGPLDTTAATNNRPSSAAITAIAAAGDALMTAINALGVGYSWNVWSPTNSAAVEVTNGWVDNAFDVQRRRGVEPSSRTTWE